MKIGWILGWAVPEGWFGPLAGAIFPGASHTFVAANPGAVLQLEVAGPFDWLVGYSLGTLLLLSQAGTLRHRGGVALLAPIFGFPREADLGGRVFRAQVRQLARQLSRDPAAALARFYEQAGLDVPRDSGVGPRLEDLLWGLERLERDVARPPMPVGWRAWCGSDDALLDAERLKAVDPAVRVIAGATHHPRALMQSFAEEVAP